MNRRKFFKSMIGGVAVAAAVRTWPFRVFSFPVEIVTGLKAIRFIKAYDVMQDKFVSRYDVLYGFMALSETRSLQLELPRAVESAEMLQANKGFLSLRQIQNFKTMCAKRYGATYFPDELLRWERVRKNEVVQLAVTA